MASNTTFDALMEAEPLSQVCFVHDYLQLVFQDWGLTIHPLPGVAVFCGGGRFERATLGFCDALVDLIGHRVTDTSLEDNAFVIHFENGAELEVSLDERHAVGPEIMELHKTGGGIFIWQYGD